MANQSRPNGFKPIGELKRVRPYVAGGIVYPGDLVKLSSGANSVSAANHQAAFNGEVIAATATGAVCGVAMTYASGAGQEVLVADHPDQLILGQVDDASIADNRDINLNLDFTATAGDATYKQSRMVITGASKAVTATLPLRLMGVKRGIPGRDGEFGLNAKAICAINNHQLKGGTGAVGVA